MVASVCLYTKLLLGNISQFDVVIIKHVIPTPLDLLDVHVM